MKVIYRSSNILKEMDDAIDAATAGSIARFELESHEWYEFLELYHQKAKGIIKFQPDNYDIKVQLPSFTYRGIGVIMV